MKPAKAKADPCKSAQFGPFPIKAATRRSDVVCAVEVLPRVLFAGGFAAAEMPLGEIFFEDPLDPEVELKIDRRQPLRDVLVYSRFAGAESVRTGTDRAACFDDIFAVFYGPLLNFLPHKNRPLSTRYSIPMSKTDGL